jgi:dihydroxyacetone kinase
MALASAGTSIAADRTATSAGATDAGPDAQVVARAVAAALAGVQRLGKAEVGDKTLVDAFAPFAGELAAAVDRGEPLAAAWSRAADAAQDAAAATAQLEPGLGRARTHVQRSLGNPDAGAVSFARIVTAIGQSLPAN